MKENKKGYAQKWFSMKIQSKKFGLKQKKTRKNGQHNKDLISLFALFFKASVTNQMLRGDNETHSCRRS